MHCRSRSKRMFPCPFCSLVCSDCFILQEHVELHLQDQASSASEAVPEAGASAQACSSVRNGEPGFPLYECPLCSLVCVDNSSLQEHVELHLEYGTAAAAGKLMEISAKHYAVILFYHKDAIMCIRRVLEALYDFHQREARDCARVWLCAETDHYSSSAGDKGWGCGYRNFQMLLSALRRTEEYTAPHTLPDAVPSIPRVQALIEAAWAEGIDPQGASHFNRKLQGTRAWIGATEIYSVLTVHRIRARIVDFHQPTGPGNTHPRLFDWVKNYFSQHSSRGARLPPRVVKTNHPPIYLQHQGHSRSIVGVEERKNGSVCLLLLDPGCPPGEMRKLLNPSTAAASVSRMRKFPGHLKHTQYQVVTAEGVLTPEEKRERIANSRTLRAERIP
uniref:Zinc finger-containing ubiquitin peptidase 1 n=1 Tax=Astyanax mexicanus TaxID=7994 RepID=A0A8B9LUK9_ASTMX